MRTDAATRNWYVIQCKPRQDGRALENLVQQGFDCYLPRVQVERIRSGRSVVAEESLFPGYLFIHLDAGKDNWAPIRSTRGVSQIIRVRDRPLPVSEQIVASIRQRLTGQRPQPHLQPGDRVVIAEGCLSRIEAIFVAREGEQRVTLLLDLLHQEHRLSVPMASVRKCAGL